MRSETSISANAAKNIGRAAPCGLAAPNASTTGVCHPAHTTPRTMLPGTGPSHAASLGYAKADQNISSKKPAKIPNTKPTAKNCGANELLTVDVRTTSVLAMHTGGSSGAM